MIVRTLHVILNIHVIIHVKRVLVWVYLSHYKKMAWYRLCNKDGNQLYRAHCVSVAGGQMCSPEFNRFYKSK